MVNKVKKKLPSLAFFVVFLRRFKLHFYSVSRRSGVSVINWHLPDVEQLQACSRGGCVYLLEPEMDEFDEDFGIFHMLDCYNRSHICVGRQEQKKNPIVCATFLAV